MKIFRTFLALILLSAGSGCKTEKENEPVPTGGNPVEIEYAKGFSIRDYGSYYLLRVKEPWPEAETSFRYLLAEDGAKIPEDIQYDEKINIPIQTIAVTSTTHIPSLEILDAEEALVAFPGLHYISSPDTRKRIAEGKISELGRNEDLNTEVLLDLQPDVLVGFAINGNLGDLQIIDQGGIPVLYNSDWTEVSPLGKAEWIKFFGVLFGKLPEATAFFEEIEHQYLTAKQLAQKADHHPTVLAGAMYKDQWYLPAGESWHAQFIQDAGGRYLFGETEGTGSLSLSLETVLSQGTGADYWIGPAQFETYEAMRDASPHYTRFAAYQQRNIYTFASSKGETGGILYYELAPNRPDLVLQDLISIFHPRLLPGYTPVFYKPLK